MSGTSNVSVVFDSSQTRYEVTVAGENYFYADYVTNITPVGGGGLLTNESSVDGKLLVFIADHNGVKTDARFNFVTWKP